jgi:nitronate monooxygenase
MLEAERAGAKALVIFMDAHPRNSEAWKILRSVQAEEAHNCALIGRLLEKSGTAYSHATGDFYDKALAFKDPKEQIAFLVRGLRWAIRKFEEALPKLDPASREIIQGIRDRHLRSVTACESLLRPLAR